MSKKLLDRQEGRHERRERIVQDDYFERKKSMEYTQGECVYAKHLALWSKGTFIQYNSDGTIRVRLGRDRVNLPSYLVAKLERNM